MTEKEREIFWKRWERISVLDLDRGTRTSLFNETVAEDLFQLGLSTSREEVEIEQRKIASVHYQVEHWLKMQRLGEEMALDRFDSDKEEQLISYAAAISTLKTVLTFFPTFPTPEQEKRG